jgi:hypothetical protein
MLARMIVRETADSFDLVNNTTIEVHVASFRGVRGYAIVAALCDELAFWPTDDAADPDYAVIDALPPRVMLADPGLVIVKPVEMDQEIHIAVEGEQRVFGE